MANAVTTISINIRPQDDPEYIRLAEAITSLSTHIDSQIVDSPESEARITKDGLIARGTASAWEKLRKEKKAPSLEAARAIDAAFNKLSGPLAQAQLTVVKKVGAYHELLREEQALVAAENARIAREKAEMQALIDEENARLQAEQMVDQETGEVTGPELIAPEPEPEYIPPIQVNQKLYTDFGSATDKKVAKWELVDILKVPIDLLMLDTKKVDKQVKAGVKNIAGIRIWEEYAVNLRAKSRKV